jgi:2-polyprenyl-6-methoxyphenol hydroxylase-like FAD-dependent oxidoreductase
VGVKVLVLEQSGGLRTEGTSLSLFPNAWRALDALGVADKLRGSFITITGYRFHSHPKNQPTFLSFRLNSFGVPLCRSDVCLIMRGVGFLLQGQNAVSKWKSYQRIPEL